VYVWVRVSDWWTLRHRHPSQFEQAMRAVTDVAAGRHRKGMS
jgi:phosphoribosylaminoimidazole carboxylase (NCAIR synthetase)